MATARAFADVCLAEQGQMDDKLLKLSYSPDDLPVAGRWPARRHRLC